MAQKTSSGVRMCLLSIQSDIIECNGVKNPKIWSVGKSQPNAPNGCNDPLNLIEIETKNVFINICIPRPIKMHISKTIYGRTMAYIGMQ